MASFTAFSSADEFSPLQSIFPNLSKSEELSVLIARIAELNRARTIEPSVASSGVFGPDGNGMNDDEFNLDDGEDEHQEDRKTRTKDVSEDHFKAILDRIGEIEKQQQQQTKAGEEKRSQLENDQKKIWEKISVLEKQQKEQSKATSDQFSKILEKISVLEKQTQKKALLKFQENYWDAFACHEDIEIIGNKIPTVYHKGNYSGYYHSVFAKYSIVLNKHLFDFFYYEISVMKKGKYHFITFGFAVKQQTELDIQIQREQGTYAYKHSGGIWINGIKGKKGSYEYSYGEGDTVGIGVHLITRQLFFTRNGRRLDSSDFFIAPNLADDSFHPFVSLLNSGDKIEANFGPDFKFDLDAL